MVEYEQQINYSMPHQCGLFPPPPYQYPQMRAIISLFQTPLEIKKKYIPPDFKPLRTSDVLFITEYADTTIGPYNESLIMLTCRHKQKMGLFVLNIYVTTDDALCAGREIWGYPKKIADINLSALKDKKVQGSLTRRGVKFLDMEIEVSDEPPKLDPKATLESLMPLYNLKIIPDIADNMKPVLRQKTATYLKFNDFTTKMSAKVNFVKTEYSKYDICHEILQHANTDLTAFYVQCDMTLPNGVVLE